VQALVSTSATSATSPASDPLRAGRPIIRDGQVELLVVEPASVVATVTGSEDYRTELTGEGKNITGECSCQAFEDSGFCKHMVAVALAANEVGGSAGGAGSLDRIRRHLATKSRDALVDMILELAKGDRELLQELDLAAAMASTDDGAIVERIRHAIDDATTMTNYVHYREVRGWANTVDKVLDSIADLLAAGRAPLVLTLIDHALSRIEDAIRSIDDSSGHGGGLLHRAAEIHLDACLACRPDPVALAGDLFAREMRDYGDTFYKAVQHYADVLGDPGLAEYRRLASAAWEKLPAMVARGRARYEFSAERSRLEAIIDYFAERDGDIGARIAIRAKNLSSPFQPHADIVAPERAAILYKRGVGRVRSAVDLPTADESDG
jgi:hypothetical protein